MLHHQLTLCLTFWRTAKPFSQSSCIILRSHQQCMSWLLHILISTSYCFSFYYRHPSMYKVTYYGFDSHFSDGVVYSFIDLLSICVSSLEKCLCKSSTHFKIGLSFYYWVVQISLFWIQVSHHICALKKNFSYFVWIVFFTSLTVFFEAQTFLILMNFNLPVFPLMVLVAYLRNHYLVRGHKGWNLHFLPKI